MIGEPGGASGQSQSSYQISMITGHVVRAADSPI